MSDSGAMYRELAEWWPLISPPADYADEAEVYRRALVAAAAIPVTTVLELGSGGGNNASHLKAHFAMTLVDVAPAMLAVSTRLNPECRHLEGDMTTLQLDELFDAVFIHDAADYLLTEAALAAALQTARLHCRPGGAVLLAPDHVAETFRAGVATGGSDTPERGVRYLEWTRDPAPGATTYRVEYAFLLREGDAVRAVLDRHTCGLFPRSTWLEALEGAGFAAHGLDVELAPGTESVLFAATLPFDD